jgi:hypothetical protein
MKLFGWKSAAAEARPPLSRYGGSVGGAIGDWPRSYEAQVRAGYVENAVAQRSVRLVAESVGGAPLSASSPALAALVGARSGGQSLLDSVAAQLLLHGNAFVQLLDDGHGGVAELFALRPERVAEDRLSVTRATFLAGAAPSVPLVEIREI